MNHYRFYELDHSEHIEAGYSVECGSDADAVRAASRLLENSPAAAVEVWQGPGRVIQLRSGRSTASWMSLPGRIWCSSSQQRNADPLQPVVKLAREYLVGTAICRIAVTC